MVTRHTSNFSMQFFQVNKLKMKPKYPGIRDSRYFWQGSSQLQQHTFQWRWLQPFTYMWTKVKKVTYFNQSKSLWLKYLKYLRGQNHTYRPRPKSIVLKLRILRESFWSAVLVAAYWHWYIHWYYQDKIDRVIHAPEYFVN